MPLRGDDIWEARTEWNLREPNETELESSNDIWMEFDNFNSMNETQAPWRCLAGTSLKRNCFDDALLELAWTQAL